ncbi:TIGR04222 domain-containing membrane protein [Kitasatospora sp. NPDC056181]|uniref:TIGR04222 domain-containing membrane protein n=1 Tax=Kitasatospora sp. NPDC056181 TaxID=3345737 RepID=UPI0035D7956B
MRVGRAGRVEELSLHELAYLAGGPWRVAETALVRLLLTARVEIDRHGMVRVVRPRPRDEVEAVLLAALGPSGTGWLGAPHAAFGPSAPARDLEARLRSRGLLVGGGTAVTGGRSLRLPTAVVVPLLIVVSVVTARTAVTVLGADPGAAMVLSSLVALLVAVALTRRTSHPDPYGRPAPRVLPLLAALRAGEPLPPGWRLPEDAPTPTGRTTWAALAVTGVGALRRRRLTAAFHGGHAWPPPRRDSRLVAGRSRADVVRPAGSPGRP